MLASFDVSSLKSLVFYQFQAFFALLDGGVLIIKAQSLFTGRRINGLEDLMFSSLTEGSGTFEHKEQQNVWTNQNQVGVG